MCPSKLSDGRLGNRYQSSEPYFETRVTAGRPHVIWD